MNTWLPKIENRWVMGNKKRLSFNFLILFFSSGISPQVIRQLLNYSGHAGTHTLLWLPALLTSGVKRTRVSLPGQRALHGNNN